MSQVNPYSQNLTQTTTHRQPHTNNHTQTTTHTHTLHTSHKPRMNFDFATHWETICLPLVLYNTKVKNSIRQAKLKFLPHTMMGMTYSPHKCLASYGQSDAWSIYMDEFKETLENKLLELGILLPDSNKPPESASNDVFDAYFSDEHPNYLLYEAYKNRIMEPFIRHHEKTALRSYQMSMSCHWSNPTFGLTLAKHVCPLENWHVRKGPHHTTVVNADETKVFDILYFDPEDPTFGGALAIKNSAVVEI